MLEKWKQERKERRAFEEQFNEEFAERFWQAYLRDPSPERAPKRPLDLSFIEKKERRRKARVRRAQIAAACLVIFLLSSLMAVHLSDHRSLAFDHPLEKILHYIQGGGYTTDPASSGREEKSQTVRITDPEKTGAALRLMPQLFVPEYLPEGWEMESLEVTKISDKSCTAWYVYKNNDEELTIEERYRPSSGKAVPEYSEVIVQNGKSFYYYEDAGFGNPGVLFFEEEVLLQVRGPLDRETLLRIAEWMKPAEQVE